MAAHQPFRVDLVLSTPMALPDQPIHLDALLCRARVDRDDVAGVSGLATPWANQYDIPLAKLETEAGWCFKASWLRFAGLGDSFLHYQTRKADVDMWREGYESGLLKRIPGFSTGSTFTRAMLVATPMQLVTFVHAFGIGDIAGVESLLRELPSLGKLKRRGAGTIDSVKVTAVDESECQWYRRNLPTTLPADIQDMASGWSLTLAEGRLQSPYWKRENTSMTLIPTA
jgi:CRISPR type IV-associated protein Csf3